MIGSWTGNGPAITSVAELLEIGVCEGDSGLPIPIG